MYVYHLLLWSIAKSATTPFKEHGTEVEEVCQQIANEVVTLITIYLQAENAVDVSVTYIERRNSLVETSLGRNWQTGSFTGSFSNNKDKLQSGDSSKFTINFMEKLQRKVRSKQQSSSADTEELQRSLKKSLTKSDSTATEQLFTEEDEETMRQLLNPDTGDADDIASQIVDRIPEDVLDLLNMKFASSSNTLPGSAEDPIESAHSIILEVLINAMSAELSDEESSTPGKLTIQKQLSKSPAVKRNIGATGRAVSSDKPEVSTNDATTEAQGKSSLFKQFSSPPIMKTFSVDKPEAGVQDGTTTTEGSTPLINAQLMFSQITTTIACAVIEKLKEALGNPDISEVPENGPALPFLSRPDDTDKEKTEHDQQTNGDKTHGTANTNQHAMATAVDDTVEYEEDMVIVRYGSIGNFPGEFIVTLKQPLYVLLV